MDKKTHDKGLEIRKAVLGEAYVANALKNADDFNKPFQELVTEYCWGAVWGREQLPRKTRSMLNLAMISILNRPHELRVHIKGALVNGVSKDEIREIFMQVAIYAGVPAGVDSFRIAREVFAELTRALDPHGEEALLRRLEPWAAKDRSNSSFETAATRPPQDEDRFQTFFEDTSPWTSDSSASARWDFPSPAA
jgi:4-carboxymuconolactone decarboxylase